MELYQIVFICLYAGVLVAYFFSEVGKSFSRRAINKILLATMFLVYSYSEFSRLGGWAEPMYCVLIAAFFFSWMGDVSLLWSFKRGGVVFGTGNLLYFAFEILYIIRYKVPIAGLLWAIPIFALPYFSVLILYLKGLVKFGQNKPQLIMSYLMSVCLHGSLGFALAFSGFPGTGLLGTGLFLFMVSDYLLFAHEFRGKKKLFLVLNSATYFSGMLIAALSVPQLLMYIN